jgi:hypothetical protein
VDAHNLATVTLQVATRPRPERCCGCCLVKRSSLWHSPVEEKRLLVNVAKTDATDVVEGAIGRRRAELNSTECQSLVDLPQLTHAIFVDLRKGIAL